MSVSRVQRVRHELKRRELQVLRVHSLGPHIRRVVFGSPALADFVSASFDDHVKLFLPGPAGAADAAPVARDYTPRLFDTAACELSIDFMLHGDGPAASWAAQAGPGQTVWIGGPRGSFVVDPAHDWHLLVGDDTALPAIARRLEELPAAVRAIVVLKLPDEADRAALLDEQALRGGPALRVPTEVHWVADDAALLAVLQDLALPPGEGYAWCAAEASLAAAVRRLLVEGKGHPRHAIRAAAYWKSGAAAHHENLEA